VIRDNLATRWRIRATDLEPADGIEVLDVTDFERCLEMFQGADAVVHLAANPSPSAEWSALRGPNIDGAHAVAAAARECGVRRLVLASSVQAVSAYPDGLQVRVKDAPRALNLYGATKAWAEALGGWVAASSDTSVVALRIGYFSERPPEGDNATPRNLSAWLSHGDCARLIQAAVESEHEGFIVANGISANRFRIVEIGEAERQIGYVPVDDTWNARDPD
jgi:nucleoside-diphosphate-sugar epimerase